MKPQKGLTKIETAPDRNEAVPGMAHFLGSGPPGTYCSRCRFYLGKRCEKYRRMMGHSGPAFSSANRSCKYYEVRT
jgi:hypothetical protein